MISKLFLLFLFFIPAILADFPGSSDEVTHLPGLHFKLHFRHYSGYLDSLNASHLHYWYFESQNNTAKDPVVVWLNGGPGCSALMGAMTEQGPLHVAEDGQTLLKNPFAWNQQTNFVYLESPAGTGFSYNDARNYTANDDSTSQLSLHALMHFFEKFPHLKENDFYLAGESYGGVLVPTLAQLLLDSKQVKNFKGYSIGNGYLDQTMLGNSFLLYTYYHGLYDTDLWESMRKSCCKGVTDLEKCDFVNNQDKACKDSIKKVHSKLDQSDLNWYNIYGKCDRGSTPSNRLTQYQVDKQFLAKHQLKIEDHPLSQDPPCMHYFHYVDQWINQKDVRHALHIVPESADWTPCTPIPYTVQYNTMLKQVRGQIKAGLKVLLYNGDVDTVCNYLGDLWFAQALGFKTMREFTPWEFEGQVAGNVKVYDGFAYSTIRGSGHMVPHDKRGPALKMFNKYLES